MKNSTNKYDIRGTKLGKDFMKGVKCFNNIIQYAKNFKSQLDIQLRSNNINIYYEGGSLLRLEGKTTIYFDENYFYQPQGSNFLRKTDIERLCKNKDIKKSKYLSSLTKEDLIKKRIEAEAIQKDIFDKRDSIIEKLKNSQSYKDTVEIIEEMKHVMKSWKICLTKNKIRTKEKGERTIQHYISLNNREDDKDSDFLVLDIEYAISKNTEYADYEATSTPRIDIIALEKTTAQLYVMELKLGMNSVDGDAGIKKHYEDYIKTVGHIDKYQAFLNDVKVLLEKKKDLNLITDKSLQIKNNKPIFAFIMMCEQPSEKYLFEKKKKELNLKDIKTFYLKNNYKIINKNILQ